MEYWDIYDKDKKVTGRTMKRNDWILQDGEYHLTVLGIVKRKSDGKYLITQRAMDKAWAPGWWEVSGGACMANEKSEDAVKREIQEETGIDVTNATGGFKFSYKRENPGQGDNYFVDVYVFELEFGEQDICVQLKEATNYKIVSLLEIQEYAKQGIFLHYDSIKSAFE